MQHFCFCAHFCAHFCAQLPPRQVLLQQLVCITRKYLQRPCRGSSPAWPSTSSGGPTPDCSWVGRHSHSMASGFSEVFTSRMNPSFGSTMADSRHHVWSGPTFHVRQMVVTPNNDWFSERAEITCSSSAKQQQQKKTQEESPCFAVSGWGNCKMISKGWDGSERFNSCTSERWLKICYY